MSRNMNKYNAILSPNYLIGVNALTHTHTHTPHAGTLARRLSTCPTLYLSACLTVAQPNPML